MSFDPQVIFELDYQNQVEEAVRINENARADFENRKASWFLDAPILRALGKPLPEKPVPAPRRTVLPDRENRKIILGYGALVADPNFDLPVPVVNPSGVTDVGAFNFDGIWAAGPLDTKPPGAIVEHQGHRLERVGAFGPFGGRGYYREVKG